MIMRKIVAVALAASVAAWAASPAPAAATVALPHHHHGWNAWHAWPAFYVIGAAASVMIDAAIVWNTQCRQLTGQEAFASAFLPIIGFVFDVNDNQCKR
jgi:hypothetical protein